jgi:putative membrane protein
MQRFLRTFATALAIAAPMTALGQATTPATQSDQSTTMAYVREAAITDRFEIDAGKIALDRSGNADVKAFAQMMVDDHTKSLAKITAATTSTAAAVPAAPDRVHGEQLQKLQQAASADFDGLYMDMQVKGHMKALQLHQDYSRSGQDPRLKAVAAEIVPVVSHHLDQAKQIVVKLGG